MQTIETKYYGPTDTKPARIRARSSAGHTLWYPIDHSGEEHVQAAETLARKLGWEGLWVCGDTRTGEVWVCLPSTYLLGNNSFKV